MSLVSSSMIWNNQHIVQRTDVERLAEALKIANNIQPEGDRQRPRLHCQYSFSSSVFEGRLFDSKFIL